MAWFVGLVVHSETHKVKPATVPYWLTALQCTYFFILAAGKGLVIIAERLTQLRPDFFPVAYSGLFAALYAPMWIWTLQKDKKLTWPAVSLGILYLIPLTFICAFKVKDSPDFWTSTHLWIIPIGIVAAFLLFAWIFKKETRKQVVLASFVIDEIVVWCAATFWVATWIS